MGGSPPPPHPQSGPHAYIMNLLAPSIASVQLMTLWGLIMAIVQHFGTFYHEHLDMYDVIYHCNPLEMPCTLSW